MTDDTLVACLGEEGASKVDVVGLFVDSSVGESANEDASVLCWERFDRLDSFGDALDGEELWCRMKSASRAREDEENTTADLLDTVARPTLSL